MEHPVRFACELCVTQVLTKSLKIYGWKLSLRVEYLNVETGNLAFVL